MNFYQYLVTLFFTTLLSLNSTAIAETVSNSPQINKNKSQGEYIRKRFLRLMNKDFDKTDKTDNSGQTKTKILIIGDSHAQDFLNSIAENNLLKNAQIRTRYIPTRCQIFLGNKSDRKWIAKDISLCQKSDSLEKAKAQIADADIIILAAMWRKWAAAHLPQTLKQLKLTADQKIFIIGRRSFSSINKKNTVGLSEAQLRSMRKEVDIHQIKINSLMSAVLDQRVFINTHKLACGSGSSCPVFTDKLKMISLDGGHLSQDGARYLGKILFEKSQLSTLIK